MRKTMILFLTCMLICTVACTVEPTENLTFTPHSEGANIIRIAVPHDFQTAAWVEDAQKEVNRLLEEEGTSLCLEIVVVKSESLLTPSSVAFNEAVLDQDNDRFDMYATMEHIENREDLVLAGSVLDITDFLPYYPELYAINREDVWQEESIEERNYWLPLTKYPQGINYTHEIQMDPVWLEELGAEPPQTVEAMVALLRLARDRGLPYKLAVLAYTPPYALHRTYVQWPFHVDYDSMLIYYADGSTQPYIGSDIFMQDAAILQELGNDDLLLWNWVGVIPSIPNEHNIAMALYGAYKRTDATYSAALMPDRPRTRTHPLSDRAMFIKSNCKNPEAALEMLQYLYCNEEIHLAFAYGVEGKDWAFQEDGTILRLTDINVRNNFYHHYIAMRFEASERLERMGALFAQEYPFSGFISTQTNYENRHRAQEPNWNMAPGSYYTPEGVSLLLTAIDDPGYAMLCQERLQKYVEFLKQ